MQVGPKLLFLALHLSATHLRHLAMCLFRSFAHYSVFLLQVDQGLETGLTPGMKLEVCVRTESESTYWVATIITTCGQLLLLRYEGYQDDRRADFWCDIMTADLHPIGWSKQQGRMMKPPEGEQRIVGTGDWSSFCCALKFMISRHSRSSDVA